MNKFIKWAVASMGLMSIAASLVLVFTPSLAFATPFSYAQCGSDSYAECSGGVRCESTDDVGCKCYDQGGRVVSRHSCAFASPEEGGEIGIEETNK